MAEAELLAGRKHLHRRRPAVDEPGDPHRGATRRPRLTCWRHPGGFMDMGVTAENLAALYGITRAEQDAFAFAPHQKAAAARLAISTTIVPTVWARRQHDRAGRHHPHRHQHREAGQAEDRVQTAGTGGTSMAMLGTPTASAVLMTSVDYARRINCPLPIISYCSG